MLVALDRRTLTTPRSRPARLGAATLLVALLAVAVLASQVPSGVSPPFPVVRHAAAPPVSFVANAGQVDARARYVAQGAGYSFFFTDHGIRMTLSRPAGAVALEE